MDKNKVAFGGFVLALFLQVFAAAVVVMLSLNASGSLRIAGFAVATLSVVAFIARSYKFFKK